MAIPNPSKAKELLDSKKKRDKEREDIKAKKKKEEAADKLRQLKYAKLMVEYAFKDALNGKRYTFISDELGEYTSAYLRDLGFEVATVGKLLESAEDIQSFEISRETASYEKLVSDLVRTMCVWVNVRYPGITQEVASHLYDVLRLGANYFRLGDVKFILENWVLDSDVDMEFTSLMPSYNKTKLREFKSLVPTLKLNHARIEKLQQLANLCLRQAKVIGDMRMGQSLPNFRLIKQIEDDELEKDQNLLTWDTSSKIPAREGEINAPLLEWLSTESGVEYMNEADLSIKGAARAGYDSVTIDALCAEGDKVHPKASDVANVFRMLGFNAEIHGETVELRWE